MAQVKHAHAVSCFLAESRVRMHSLRGATPPHTVAGRGPCVEASLHAAYEVQKEGGTLNGSELDVKDRLFPLH